MDPSEVLEIVPMNESFYLGDNFTVTSPVYLDKHSTPYPPLYILVLTSVFCAFEFFVGIIGNLLVAVVIWKNKDMRNSTNFFLMNLSLADLMVIVVCMPSAVMELHARDYWYLGEFMCKLVPFLEHSVAHASVLTILVISYERYFAICQPLKAQYICTLSRTMKLIAGVWLVAFTASVPFFSIALFKDSRYINGTPIKVCRQPLQTPLRRAYIIGLMVVFFVIPVIVLAVLYTLISKKLFRDAICPEMRVDKRAMATLTSRRQVVVLLLAVVVLFLVCSLPWRVLTAWLAFAENSDVGKLGFEGYLNLVYFARVMFYFNSCVNPIIYNMVSTKFRRAFKMALTCQKRVIQRQDTVTYTTVTSLTRHQSSIYSNYSNTSLRTLDRSMRLANNSSLFPTKSARTNEFTNGCHEACGCMLLSQELSRNRGSMTGNFITKTGESDDTVCRVLSPIPSDIDLHDSDGCDNIA